MTVYVRIDSSNPRKSVEYALLACNFPAHPRMHTWSRSHLQRRQMKTDGSASAALNEPAWLMGGGWGGRGWLQQGLEMSRRFRNGSACCDRWTHRSFLRCTWYKHSRSINVGIQQSVCLWCPGLVSPTCICFAVFLLNVRGRAVNWSDISAEKTSWEWWRMSNILVLADISKPSLASR